MPEPKNQLFRPTFSKELNIESIISAPLVAASKANATMVTGQTRFLLDYCFRKNLTNNTYEPIMIKMIISRSEIDHDKKPGDKGYLKQVKLNFSTPILTLIPINSLAIDKVTVDFDMEITSVTSYESAHGILDKQAVLNGRISNNPNTGTSDKEQGKNQLSSRLKVSINAGALPLPVGVLTILDMYQKAIRPYALETKSTE